MWSGQLYMLSLAMVAMSAGVALAVVLRCGGVEEDWTVFIEGSVMPVLDVGGEVSGGFGARSHQVWDAVIRFGRLIIRIIEFHRLGC